MENLEQYAEVALVICSVITSVIGFFLGKKRANAIESTVRTDLESNLPQVLADYEKYKQRSEEYFAKIEEVLSERDSWRELYNDQAAGHDNAQALMMSTIQNLVRSFQAATGKTPKIDPLIEAVRTDFVGKHGAPARAARNESSKEKGSKAKEAPVETTE